MGHGSLQKAVRTHQFLPKMGTRDLSAGFPELHRSSFMFLTGPARGTDRTLSIILQMFSVRCDYSSVLQSSTRMMGFLSLIGHAYSQKFRIFAERRPRHHRPEILGGKDATVKQQPKNQSKVKRKRSSCLVP